MAKLSKTTRTRTKVSIFTVFETFSAKDCEVKNSRSKSDGSKERNRLEIGSQMAKLSKTTRTRTKLAVCYDEEESLEVGRDSEVAAAIDYNLD